MLRSAVCKTNSTRESTKGLGYVHRVERREAIALINKATQTSHRAICTDAAARMGLLAFCRFSRYAGHLSRCKYIYDIMIIATIL